MRFLGAALVGDCRDFGLLAGEDKDGCIGESGLEMAFGVGFLLVRSDGRDARGGHGKGRAEDVTGGCKVVVEGPLAERSTRCNVGRIVFDLAQPSFLLTLAS